MPRNVAMATIFWLFIYGMHIGATLRIRLNRPCVAAMRPYVILLWPLVSSSRRRGKIKTNTSCYLRASINFLCKLIIYITLSGSKLYLHLINYNYSNNSVGNTNLPYSSSELEYSNKQWNKMRRPITLDNSWSPDRPNSRPLDEQSAVFVQTAEKPQIHSLSNLQLPERIPAYRHDQLSIFCQMTLVWGW